VYRAEEPEVTTPLPVAPTTGGKRQLVGSKCTQSLLLYFQPFISALYTNIKLLTGPSPSLGGQGSDNVPLLLTPDNDQPRVRTAATGLRSLAKVLTKLRAAAVPSLLRRHFHIQSIT